MCNRTRTNRIVVTDVVREAPITPVYSRYYELSDNNIKISLVVVVAVHQPSPTIYKAKMPPLRLGHSCSLAVALSRRIGPQAASTHYGTPWFTKRLAIAVVSEW